MSLSFITTNPATAAFQQGVRFLQQQEMDDLRLQEARRTAGENESLSASRVQAGQAQNARTVMESNEFAATSPDRITQSANNTSLSSIKVGEAGYDLDEKTDPNRRAARDTMAGAQATQASTQAKRSEGQLLIDTMTLIEQGNTPGAQELAKTYGFEIPEVVLKNRQVATSIKALGEQGLKLYPNDPKAQSDFMAEKARQVLADPALLETNPGAAVDTTGLKDPPDMATAKGATKNDFQLKLEAGKAIGYSDREAFEMALGNKPTTDAQKIEIARKITASLYPSGDMTVTPAQRQKFFDKTLTGLRDGTFGNTPPAGTVAPGAEEAEKPASEGRWYNPFSWGGSDEEPAASAAPAQAARPAAESQSAPAQSPAAPASQASGQRPQTLTQAGTQQDPLIPTSQADVDWFKRYGDPNTLMKVGGTLFRGGAKRQ